MEARVMSKSGVGYRTYEFDYYDVKRVSPTCPAVTEGLAEPHIQIEFCYDKSRNKPSVFVTLPIDTNTVYFMSGGKTIGCEKWPMKSDAPRTTTASRR